ncbi:MAG: condensation domain-containing protein [Cytophagales bacterium]|nr:condensation domain-containing protein [Cytophagales bacterium]
MTQVLHHLTPEVRGARLSDPSPKQDQDWHINQSLGEGKPAAIIPLFMSLPPETTVDQAKQAYSWLVARHESLRTYFPKIEGELRQAIVDVDTALFELEHWQINTQEDFHKYEEEEWRRVISHVEAPPLTRAAIVKNDHKLTLVFFIHHIVADVWSLKVIKLEFLSYLKALRSGLEPNLPPQVQVADYFQENKNSKLANQAKHIHYWESVLGDKQWHFRFDRLIENCLNGAVDNRLKHWSGVTQDLLYQDPEGAFYNIYMPSDLYKKLEAYCEQQEISVNSLLLGSWALFGCLVTKTESILIRSLYSNRLSSKSHQVVGNLLSDALQLFRMDMNERILDFMIRNYSNAFMSFRKSVQDLRPLEASLQVGTRCFMMFNFVGRKMNNDASAIIVPPRIIKSQQIWSPLFCNTTEYSNTILFECGFHHRFLNEQVVSAMFQKFFGLLGKLVASDVQLVSDLNPDLLD